MDELHDEETTVSTHTTFCDKLDHFFPTHTILYNKLDHSFKAITSNS